MRALVQKDGFVLWLSADDTYNWANKPHAHWPCSTLSNKRMVAVFDSNGLCDISVNGRVAGDGELSAIDGTEFSAIVADFMRAKLPADHACRFIAVDQFAD